MTQQNTNTPVSVIGAGLAGCEAAWTLANAGVPVKLYEMKPHCYSPAHKYQGFAELILQPQSEIPHFRTFLMDEGYLLLDENIIYEEGKYYFMMKVRWLGAMTDDAVRQKVGDSWKTEGLDPGLAEKFGPLLLSRRDRILREYLEWMLTERRQIVGRMEQKADADNPRTICRRQEIADEITLITRALDWYDNGKEADCI